jgi:hypothetical protein
MVYKIPQSVKLCSQSNHVGPTLRDRFGLNLSAFEAPCQLLSFAALRRTSFAFPLRGLRAVERRAFRFLPDHREFAVKPAERGDKDVRRRAANDRSNARHRSTISSQALRGGLDHRFKKPRHEVSGLRRSLVAYLSIVPEAKSSQALRGEQESGVEPPHSKWVA